MFSLGLITDFDTTPKAQPVEEKFDDLDLIKMENTCPLKYTVWRTKRQAMGWQKKIAKHF